MGVEGEGAYRPRAGTGAELPGRLHCGAVSFTQYFGSTLQPTPHLHVLCPDGVFIEAEDGAVRFVPLPPPTPEDDAESLRAQALQQSLPFAQVQSLAAVQPRKHHRRLAVAEGFSLYADTHVHAQDRQGLERLCRYGARGPLAEEVLRDIGRLPPHPPLATGPPAPQLALPL